MRVWTLHPKYLDAAGLVALWRESLLAQKVLNGETKGYRNHPQLARFRECANPITAIGSYLDYVAREAELRGYSFDRSRVLHVGACNLIDETEGQLLYEWKHLKNKLALRSPKMYDAMASIKSPEAHPIFRIVEGDVRDWEKVKR